MRRPPNGQQFVNKNKKENNHEQDPIGNGADRRVRGCGGRGGDAVCVGRDKGVDDLQGLRPDTQGVQTNAFWDTRAHLTYTVQSSLGASTNAIETAFLTIDVSEPATIGGAPGTVICFR